MHLIMTFADSKTAVGVRDSTQAFRCMLHTCDPHLKLLAETEPRLDCLTGCTITGYYDSHQPGPNDTQPDFDGPADAI